jgi:hypothetical protein
MFIIIGFSPKENYKINETFCVNEVGGMLPKQEQGEMNRDK